MAERGLVHRLRSRTQGLRRGDSECPMSATFSIKSPPALKNITWSQSSSTTSFRFIFQKRSLLLAIVSNLCSISFASKHTWIVSISCPCSVSPCLNVIRATRKTAKVYGLRLRWCVFASLSTLCLCRVRGLCENRPSSKVDRGPRRPSC